MRFLKVSEVMEGASMMERRGERESRRTSKRVEGGRGGRKGELDLTVGRSSPTSYFC